MTTRIKKILLYSISSIFILIVLLALATVFFLKSSKGQSIVSDFATKIMSESLGTPVSGDISYGFPDWIKVDKLLIIDSQKDTLLYSSKLGLDMDMLALLDNKLKINEIKLENSYLNVTQKEGVYNFDAILEKLTGGEPDTISTPIDISLSRILLLNFRAKYAEDQANTNLTLRIAKAKTGFNKIDTKKQIFDFKNLEGNGFNISGNINTPKPQKTDTTNSVLPLVSIRSIVINDINWNLNLFESSTKTTAQKIDLLISLDQIDLQKEIYRVSDLKVSGKSLTYNNLKANPQNLKSFNADDISFENISLKLKDLSYKKGDAVGLISEFVLKEKSGLEIMEFQTNFDYSKDILKLGKLTLKTPKSNFNAGFELNLKNKLSYIVKIENSNLALEDALFFDSSLSKNENYLALKKEKLTFEGSVSGNENVLNIKDLKASILKNTKLNVLGSIKDFGNPFLDLTIKNINTTKQELAILIPKSQMPKDFEIPENIGMTGTVLGRFDNIKVNLNLKSTDGNAQLNAQLVNFGTKKQPVFSGKMSVDNFQAGKIIKNKELGSITGAFNFDGVGIDPAKMKVNIDGAIKDVFYDGKQYKNISLKGSLKDQLIDSEIGIKDNGADVTWKGTVNLKSGSPVIIGKTYVNELNLKTLGLIDDNITIKGDFDLYQVNLDTKDPVVDFEGKNVIIAKDGVSYTVGNVRLLTEKDGKTRSVFLKTDFMNFAASGNFEYSQLKDVILGEINKYFEIPNYKPIAYSQNYTFNIDGFIKYDSVFKVIVPKLTGFKPINIHSRLSSDVKESISGNISVPYLEYDSIKIYKTKFDFKGDGVALRYNLFTDQVSNNSVRVRNASLIGKLEDNTAEYDLAVKDSLNQSIHALSGYIQSIDNKVRLSFNERGTLLFYDKWSGNPYGYIDYDEKGLNFSDVIFTNHNQILRVNSRSDVPNGPLLVFTENLDLNKLGRAFLQDSTLVGGMLDLDLELVNYMETNPYFTGDFSIIDFMTNSVSLGKLTGRAESLESSKIKINANLDGLESEFTLNGIINTETSENLDLELLMKKINVKIIEPYTVDVANDLKGNIDGKLKIGGSFDKPDINGNIGISELSMKLIETGAILNLKNQNIALKDQQILFDKLEILDVHEKKMIVDGFVNISQLPDYNYQIKIESDDFKLIDAKQGDNELYFGEGYFKSNLLVKGRNTVFKLTGNVGLIKGSNLTMLLPDDASATSELENIVTFVDFSNTKKKSNKAVKKNEAISFANAVNINVDINEDVILNMLMDPITGDIMTVKGKAKINTGFNNNGDLFMIGKYEIVEGVYNLSYQIIKKEFKINENSNSYISWSGDPMEADLKITAEYAAGKKSINTYPMVGARYDNLKSQNLNIPVRVDLVVTGVLSNPNIDFEMVLSSSDVGNYADDLKSLGFKIVDERGSKEGSSQVLDNTKIKNQAIILLVSGAFTSEQFVDNATDIKNYENLARKTASDLISSQLNRYASGIVKGIDLDLGVQSGYNTANDSRNTNLSLGVKKKLANDRIVISIGKNFELENKDLRSDEIFDNIDAAWNITKDGRFKIKVFRKNQNQAAVEGAVVETGLGFIIAIDYDTWRKLTHKP